MTLFIPQLQFGAKKVLIFGEVVGVLTSSVGKFTKGVGVLTNDVD